jgi:hypothetical protein
VPPPPSFSAPGYRVFFACLNCLKKINQRQLLVKLFSFPTVIIAAAEQPEGRWR